jgi:hypothetical protein
MSSRIHPELDPLGNDFRDTDRPSSASTMPKFKNTAHRLDAGYQRSALLLREGVVIKGDKNGWKN